MTAVYYTAPVAVKRTVFTTILPPEVTLTTKEARDLCELEDYYGFYILPPYGLDKKFNFSSTPNAGIHYFCLQHDVHLEPLATNKSISVEVAFLILWHKVLEEHPDPASTYVLYNLLRNPVVYKDADLFEIVFENALGNNDKDLLISLRRSATYFPIQSLILVFMEIKKHNSPALVRLYSNLAVNRKAEITAWTSKTYPEMDGLPFSWIMKASGFGEGFLDD